MLLHKFVKPLGLRAVLTPDAKGENLPKEGKPWKRWIYQKSIEISATDGPRIGASSEDIIAGIEAKGYFFWPAEVKDA